MNKSHVILLSVLFIILQAVAISCTNKQRADKAGNTEDSVTLSTENTSAKNTSNGYVNFVTG